MKNFKKPMALLLSALMLMAMMPTVVQAEETVANETKNFIIDNPYEEINWDKWGMYKTQLHCQTTASDGFLPIDQFVKIHYALNYDIVALTDHGTINQGWNKVPQTVPLVRYIKRERTQMSEIIPVPQDEYEAYLNGTNTNTTYVASDGTVLTRTHENGMLDVPQGIELNMATPIADCHLTGYFSDYGQGLAGVFGDYETPSEGVMKAGGFSYLSHVGEYVYTDKDSENYVGLLIDDYYPTKFARLFIDYAGSSLGMGINSASDAHTRCDRILYDQILQKTIPNGVVPWGNTFADSHNETSVNDAYTMVWMPELTLEAFRESQEKGHYFSISHYSNGVELNGMEEIPGFDEDEVFDSGSFWLDNTPMVTRIEIDEKNDTITVWGVNFNQITWVSDAQVINRTTLNEGVDFNYYVGEDGATYSTEASVTLDLHSEDLLSEPNLYARFYITGINGICYSQPFVLNVEGETFTPVEVPETHDISTFLRTLVTILDYLFFKTNPIIWIFKYFALGYDPIEQLVDSTVDIINSIFANTGC